MIRNFSTRLLFLSLLACLSVVSLQAQGEFTLFFTGYVHGAHEPCGWKVNPTGGLARRAGYMESYRQEHEGPVISVDAGGFFQPPGPGSTAVNQIMKDALTDLPVDVFNLNSDDLEVWPDLAKASLDRTAVISTNLQAPPSVPAPLPYVVRNVKVGEAEVRIGFLGLADGTRVAPRSGFTTADPLTAVARIKAEVMKQADFLVVLADLPDSVIDQLAQANPEIYVVVALERRFTLARPRQVENAVILKSVERGRFLGRLTLDVDAQGRIVSYRPEMVELNSSIPESDLFAGRSR